ncbi:MAG: hypothetical protein KDE56_28740 [Anaerolineales bacterium]|nr:hypothetical protein [Anaerolineales bacterium]
MDASYYQARFLGFVGVMFVALLLLGNGQAVEAMGKPLSGWGSATIDGLMSPGEWDGADSFVFYVNDFHSSQGRPMTLFVMNDETHLYVAIRYTGNVYYGQESMIDLDSNGSHTVPDVGDDRWFVNHTLYPPLGTYTTTLDDQFITSCDTVTCFGTADGSDGGTLDVAAAVASDGAYTYHEFAQPLNSGDGVHDVALQGNDKIWLSGHVRLYDPLATRFDGTIPPVRVRILK